MSGFSDDTICFNCGGSMNRYSDYKPFDIISLECLECGVYTSTVVEQMTLEELNDMRVEQDLPELKVLPEKKDV